MGLFLSVHALTRMKSRGIERHEIEWVLAHPEVAFASEEGPDKTVTLGTTASGRRLKVVNLTADPDYIVTVAARDEEA